MKLIFLFLLLSTFASAQTIKTLPKCTEYVLYGRLDTVYAFKECGKHWTINDNAKGTAFIDSKLKAATTNFTTMDSLRTKAAKLVASWLILSTSYNADAQTLLVKKYLDIPAAPTQTSPSTLTPANFDSGGAGFFSVPSGGAARHIKTSGSFTAGFCGRSFVGTAGSPFIIVNTAGDIIGAVASGTHGVSTVTDSDYFNWYGLSDIAPYVMMSGTGGNGLQLPSRSGGSHFVVRNVVVKNPSASGLTANFPVNGTNYYESLDISFLRSFNAGQEGIHYIGNTTGTSTTPNYVNTATVTHCFSYNSSREGTQAEHINLYTASYNTCVLPGSNWNGAGGPGQQNCFQAHDLGPGSSISYSVYDQGVDLWNIFTHGFRVHHNYFSFSAKTGTAPQTYNGFIGRTDNQIWYAASPRMSGDSLIFENDYFKYTGAGTLDYLTIVEERIAHIIFRNCTFSANIAHIMKDNRAVGFSNTLTGDIGDHGNVSATINPPIFAGSYNDPDNYLVQGLQTMTSPYKDWAYRGIIHYP